MFHTFFYCFYCYFEQVNVEWAGLSLANHAVVLVLLLLTSNIFHTFSSVSNVDFEQVNVSLVSCRREQARFLAPKVFNLKSFWREDENTPNIQEN